MISRKTYSGKIDMQARRLGARYALVCTRKFVKRDFQRNFLFSFRVVIPIGQSLSRFIQVIKNSKRQHRNSLLYSFLLATMMKKNNQISSTLRPVLSQKTLKDLLPVKLRSPLHLLNQVKALDRMLLKLPVHRPPV